MSSSLDYEKEVSQQAKTRRQTVEFINIVNDLWYDRSIELVLFRNPLVDKRAGEVLNLINYAKEFVNKPITIQDALSIAKAIQKVDLPSSKLDIGKLAYECHLNPKGCEDKIAFVKKQLKNATEFKAKGLGIYAVFINIPQGATPNYMFADNAIVDNSPVSDFTHMVTAFFSGTYSSV